jgi:hypothetical protein
MQAGSYTAYGAAFGAHKGAELVGTGPGPGDEQYGGVDTLHAVLVPDAVNGALPDLWVVRPIDDLDTG